MRRDVWGPVLVLRIGKVVGVGVGRHGVEEGFDSGSACDLKDCKPLKRAIPEQKGMWRLALQSKQDGLDPHWAYLPYFMPSLLRHLRQESVLSSCETSKRVESEINLKDEY